MSERAFNSTMLAILAMFLIFAGWIVSCVAPPPPAPAVRCETDDLKKKIALYEERIDYLETRCNPVFGEWNNCEQWVFDRWYHRDPSCEGDIYPGYSEGEEF